jgi:hypothetical protein
MHADVRTYVRSTGHIPYIYALRLYISFPSTVLIDHACTIERLVACMQRHAQQRKPRDSDAESMRDSPTLYTHTNNN